MDRMPLGIGRLDDTLNGGAPPGNTVLLAGESGAGAREFLYTAATMHALRKTDPELFDLYYGDEPSAATFPEEVHYLSFTAGQSNVERDMGYTMTDEVVGSAVPEIQFRDFSPEYFDLSPIPREWYMGERTRITDLGQGQDRDELLEAMGAYLNEHAPGNLVCIDSITDLVGSISGEMEWTDIAVLMKGLAKAAHNWGGLVLMVVNIDALREQEYGHLMDAAGGTFEFTWETGGSQRARTMIVREFRGILSEIQEEDIVRFETEVHEGGFDISDVRKIR